MYVSDIYIPVIRIWSITLFLAKMLYRTLAKYIYVLLTSTTGLPKTETQCQQIHWELRPRWATWKPCVSRQAAVERVEDSYLSLRVFSCCSNCLFQKDLPQTSTGLHIQRPTAIKIEQLDLNQRSAKKLELTHCVVNTLCL